MVSLQRGLTVEVDKVTNKSVARVDAVKVCTLPFIDFAHHQSLRVLRYMLSVMFLAMSSEVYVSTQRLICRSRGFPVCVKAAMIKMHSLIHNPRLWICLPLQPRDQKERPCAYELGH